MTDILSVIIDKLRTNTDIKTLLGITSSADYYKVRMESLPEPKIVKPYTSWIILRYDSDPSEAVLPANKGLITINCYVREYLSDGIRNQNVYKKLRELSNKVETILNKQNRDLDVGEITIYQIVKTNVRDFYEADTHLWRGLITLEVVLYENNPS